MNSVLSPTMGSAVLTHLRDLSGLDFSAETGVVAGQAVASAVEDLFFNGVGGVYNDIDLFQPDADNSLLTWGHHVPRARIRTELMLDHEAECDYLGVRIGALPRYVVQSSRRDALLNRVHVAYRQKEQQAYSLISAFDLNCTQVGVDLATRELVWTPEYARFLQTRQLEISAYHSPFHTVIRFLRKLAALPNVYGDTERVISGVLAVACSCQDNSVKPLRIAAFQGGEAGWWFGPTMKAKYDEVADVLAPWFTLVHNPATHLGKPDIYSLLPRQSADEDLVAVLRRYPVKLAAPVLHALTYPAKPLLRQRMRELVVAKSGQISPAALLWCRTGCDRQAVEQVARAEDRTLIENVCHVIAEHPRVEPLIAWLAAEIGMDKAELRGPVFAWSRKQAASHGTWVYGMVESMDSEWAAQFKGLHEGIVAQVIEALDQHLADTIEQGSKPLAAPIAAAAFAHAGMRIRPLLTWTELMQEGEDLHHCVGGYSEFVSRGGLILSLRGSAKEPATWSTAEVHWVYEAKRKQFLLKLCQHKGPCNSKPVEANTQALATLLVQGGPLWRAMLKRNEGTTLLWVARWRQTVNELRYVWESWRYEVCHGWWHSLRKQVRERRYHDALRTLAGLKRYVLHPRSTCDIPF